MKCPHCMVAFHDRTRYVYLDNDIEGTWGIGMETCPACNRLILYLIDATWTSTASAVDIKKARLIRPKGTTRPPCPGEVPPAIAEDYIEACLVLPDSPKASAALSRRCLQNILREKAKVTHGSLADEIQEVLDAKTLPPYIAEVVDLVRTIGNFAAHPIKSTKSGEIIPVEPGEAECNLDVIEALFDFYFVQPVLLQKKRDAINQKLTDAGKKPIKTT